MRRRTREVSARALVLLLAALAALSAAASGVGGNGPALRQRAAALRAADAGLAREEHSALLDLYALESRLGGARARLAALRGEVASLARQRATAQTELRVARRSLAAAERRLATQLRLLYEDGDASRSSLAILLGASSFDDAMTQLDDLDRAATQNRSVAAAVRTARGELTALVRRLRDRQARVAALASAAAATELSLERAEADRQAYLDRLRLQRALGASQIAALEAQAQAAEQRARTIAVHVAPAPPAAPSVPTPAPAPRPSSPAQQPGAGGGALAVSSTGYSLDGRTATGVPVGWGVAAVDPAVIPLGTRFYVPGYGEVVAADVGPGVQGASIDLWFPSTAQALQWGRRAVTVEFG